MENVYPYDFSEKDLLVVVDAQVDFVTGVLGTKEAQRAVPGIVDLVSNFPGTKVFTQDTHDINYLNTMEGRRLKVPHTIIGTEGWKIVPQLRDLVTNNDLVVQKYSFGSDYLYSMIKSVDYRRIYFVGFCTGFCVISNVVAAKTANPEADVYVIEPLCACATPESHTQAISVMENMFINIVR